MTARGVEAELRAILEDAITHMATMDPEAAEELQNRLAETRSAPAAAPPLLGAVRDLMSQSSYWPENQAAAHDFLQTLRAIELRAETLPVIVANLLGWYKAECERLHDALEALLDIVERKTTLEYDDAAIIARARTALEFHPDPLASPSAAPPRGQP